MRRTPNLNPAPMYGPAPQRPAPFSIHRLSIVGESVAELVEHAGAWMFDHARSGWVVTAHIPDTSDTRPLRILGVGVDHGLPRVWAAHRCTALAVSAATLRHVGTVAQLVTNALDNNDTDVTLWGETLPKNIIRRLRRSEYRLTPAAAAFKAQALQAATGVLASKPNAPEVLFTNAISGQSSALTATRGTGHPWRAKGS
jgi:hypothetical protein